MQKSDKSRAILETLTIAFSAPLAGAGVAVLLNGNAGLSFVLIGLSLKVISAYMTLPQQLFDVFERSLTAEEAISELEKHFVELEKSSSKWKMLSNLGTYLAIGGFFCLDFAFSRRYLNFFYIGS